MTTHDKEHIRLNASGPAGQPEPQAIIALALRRKFSSLTRPVLVAVGGPGGTGKSTFARKLADELGQAVILPLDDYKTPRAYRAGRNLYGPHPEANEMLLIKEHLSRLRQGAPVDKPVYCRQKGCASRQELFCPGRFVIAEGEIATYREFHDEMDFAIFIDAHWKTQLNTRITRDIDERGYTPQKAIAAFLYSNLHEFAEYGAESKTWADIHIHCDEHYRLVIDAVCSKSAAFLVDDVSTALAGVLPAGV